MYWRRLDVGADFPVVTSFVPRMEVETGQPRSLIISETDFPTPTAVFVAVFQGANARVFLSSDGGTTWTEQVSALPFATSAFAWGHSALCITPNNLYIGGASMFIGEFIEGVGFLFAPTGGPI